MQKKQIRIKWLIMVVEKLNNLVMVSMVSGAFPGKVIKFFHRMIIMKHKQ